MSLLQYIGIPYEVHGKPPYGADCYTLIRDYAERERHIILPPYMYEANECYASAAIFIRDAENNIAPGWHRVDRQADCVVVFRVMGLVMHCGWMINMNDFLHAFEGRNSAVESINDFYWAKRVQGFFVYE